MSITSEEKLADCPHDPWLPEEYCGGWVCTPLPLPSMSEKRIRYLLNVLFATCQPTSTMSGITCKKTLQDFMRACETVTDPTSIIKDAARAYFKRHKRCPYCGGDQFHVTGDRR